MALKLRIEGRVLEVRQPEPYCVTDGQAARWAEAGRAERAARNPNAAPVVVRVHAMSALLQLADRGSIRREQVMAGREIQAYWQMWARAFTSAIADYRQPQAGGAAAEPASVRALVDRYRSWAAWAEAERVRGELSALQLTLDLCLMDRTPWALRQVYRVSDVRALRVVQISLHQYARLAGWVDEDGRAIAA